ncbi:MAG: hypothetical protein ACF8Q5_01720 [Phycisphaerales bacterium JB040]
MTHGRRAHHQPADGSVRTRRSGARALSSVGAAMGVCSLVLIVGGVGGLVGCRQPPLRADDPRSQYDRYDLSRSELEPAYRYDEFGRRRPNLRGRLLDDR